MNTATMPRNEAGTSEASEFELVLGNKQLLSVFFIVVVLLGVFFTMGYIVGRNSAPVDTARKSDIYDRGNAPSAVPTTTAKAPVTIVEQPATDTAVATESTAAKAEVPVAEPQKPIDIPAVSPPQPEAGRTYLQVVSVARPQADALAEVLAKRGFRAFVAPGPNEKTFRVLVGPAANIDDVSRIKSDLEAVGMKPIVKKY